MVTSKTIITMIVLFPTIIFTGCVAMIEAKMHYEPPSIMNSSPRSIMVEHVDDGELGKAQSLAEQECQKYDGRHAIQKHKEQTAVKGSILTYECVE
jgi:hypothetical protein